MSGEAKPQDRSGSGGLNRASLPLVSIILACRCEVPHIGAALASILAQEPPQGGFEIVVADGMSEDGTRDVVTEIARTNPSVRMIDNPARFTAAGLNAAIRAAAGDILVRMDAHTRYAPDYLRQCVAVLRETGADNVGGAWVAQAEGCVGEAIAAAFQSGFAVGGARSHLPDYEGEVDTVYLGCWRKEAFRRFGGFDETLVRNQDDEHNLRIVRSRGHVWQSAKIRSWYQPRTSLKSLFRQYLQYGYWKVQVIRKHGRPASLRHLVPGFFVLMILGLGLACFFGLGGELLWMPVTVPGVISSWLWSCAIMGLVFLVSLYVLALLVASLQTARRARWGLLPLLPLVFSCFHFGYGLGFLKGVLDFVVLKRGAAVSMSGISREALVQNLPARS